MISKFKNAVNKHFHLDISEVNRQYEYVVARSCFYKICRDIVGLSYSKIAQSVGKNHATVLHALKEFENILACDPVMNKKCQQLFDKFEYYNKKKHNMTLDQLVKSYNMLLMENDILKKEVKDLELTIYYLADLE